MDFMDVWGARGWDSERALAVALEAIGRGGREVALVEWLEPESGPSDFLAVADSAGWSNEVALAAILAYAEDSGFTRQLDAHARRVARRDAPDPDHYGD